jgi:hypothetical protein
VIRGATPTSTADSLIIRPSDFYAACAVLMPGILEHDLLSLAASFDVNGDGAISVAEFAQASFCPPFESVVQREDRVLKPIYDLTCLCWPYPGACRRWSGRQARLWRVG